MCLFFIKGTTGSNKYGEDPLADWYEKGQVYLSNNDYDGAITAFNNAISLVPSNPAAYFSRGDTYFRKGLFDEAIADLSKAIDLNPKHYEAYWGKAQCMYNLNRYNESIMPMKIL